MKNFKYTITDDLGIHARPAGLLVREAQKYTSLVTIKKGVLTTNASSLMGVMGLAIKKGDTIEIIADGPDEEAAIDGIKTFFENNL